MENKKNEPSIFLGALTGYASGTAIGILCVLGLSIRIGYASAAEGMKYLAVLSGIGVYLGYRIAVKRRRALGIVGHYDEWPKFFASWMGVTFAVIVIVGSIEIAKLIKSVFDAVVG
jgi:hypothetical protein